MTNAGRPISSAAPPIRFESVAISTSYPTLSTIFSPLNTARGGGPSPLTSRSLSRTILASAEGKSFIHRHAFSRFELEVSAKVEVISLSRIVRMTVRFLKVRTRGDRQVGPTISIKVVFFAVLCPALLQRFHPCAAATRPKRPSANIRARTETFGGACCVCRLQTGHHIVGGRMPREKQNLFEHSIQPIAEGDYLLPTRSLASTLAARSRSFQKTTCGWHRPQASTRLLHSSQRRMHPYSTQDQMVITDQDF